MSQPIGSGKSVEASGRTVEDAIQKALARLGRQRDEVDVRVLREASSGLLGIGGHDAIVRVTEIPAGSLPAMAEPSQPAPVLATAAVASEALVEAPRATEVGLPATEDVSPETAEVQEDEATPGSPNYHARDEDDDAFSHGSVDREELLEISREVLLEILGRMRILADVQARWVEPADTSESAALILDIIGDDLGMLIGRRGETLRDLQYIVRLMVGRKIGGWANIVVDVEGYKQRREMSLRRMARQLADRVALSRKAVFMEPMAAYERRIVHLELRNHPKVSTQSSGEGERRKVGIYPR